MLKRYLQNSVLVVDDDHITLQITSIMLKRLGFANVYTAEGGKRALELLPTTSPPVNLLITDLHMPGTDGLALLRHFDEIGFQGDIILFSGMDEQTLKMAMSLGKARSLSIIGALSKPLREGELLNTLSNHVSPAPCTFGPCFRKPPSEQVITPNMLVDGIEKGELQPWFQPKVDMVNHTITGLEVLARWPKSTLGPIFPDTFIPIAEKHGLIDELTFYLVKKTLDFKKQWQSKGLNISIAFNVSMDSCLNHKFSTLFELMVTNAGFKASDFQLEITESRLMSDIVTPLEVLLRLHMHGVKLSIDDFGTGHSNLNQLRDLPFDELKLDKSYVQTSKECERAKIILKTSIKMAEKLGMSIVAEGVETREDWQRMLEMGCHQAQGYFIAKPMPGEDIPDWIEYWQKIRPLFRGSTPYL